MSDKVEIIPFEPHHLILLDLQEEQKYFLEHFTDVTQIVQYGEILRDNAANTSENTKCAWSARLGDEIIGCGGIISISDHIGEAWTLLGDKFTKYAHRIAPVIKKQAAITNKERIYALIDLDFERAERFIKWVGLEYEGTLRKSGTKRQDQKLFAKIKEI